MSSGQMSRRGFYIEERRRRRKRNSSRMSNLSTYSWFIQTTCAGGLVNNNAWFIFYNH